MAKGPQWVTKSEVQELAELAFNELPVNPAIGTVRNVSDSVLDAWGTPIKGGGTHHVLARFNGTVWTVVGK